MNLTDSGLFCVLPWLTMAFSANLGGWLADTLVSKGLSVTTVRKVPCSNTSCLSIRRATAVREDHNESNKNEKN